MSDVRLIYRPDYTLRVVKGSNANISFTNAEWKGSTVLKSVVEIILTAVSRPVDFNIISAAAEVTAAGAGNFHLLTTVIVDGFSRNIENNYIELFLYLLM